MKTWAAELIAWLAAIALLGGCVAKTRAEWVNVPVVRNTGYGGVFGEVQDRLRGPTRFTGKRFDVWPHEDTHILNSQISRRHMAFYLPGGKACVVPMTGMQVRHIAGLVPTQYRGSWVYRLYFEGRPPRGMQCITSQGTGFQGQSSITNNPALVPFDELSAFTCEAVIQWEREQDTRQAVYAASWLSYYCSLVALHLRNRGYSHWEELHDFTVQAYAHLKQLRSSP